MTVRLEGREMCVDALRERCDRRPFSVAPVRAWDGAATQREKVRMLSFRELASRRDQGGQAQDRRP